MLEQAVRPEPLRPLAMSTAPDPRHAELVAWLAEQGHSPDQVAKILAKVAEYDARTINESIFDSISDMTHRQIEEFLELATRDPTRDGPEQLEER